MNLRKSLRRLSARESGRSLALGETISWWETRRVLFNAMVAAAGLFATVLVVMFSLIADTECGLPDPPLFALFGVAAYAVVANICYTGGWVVELLFVRTPERRNRFAERAFRVGMVGSAAFTALPGVVVPLLCVIGRIATGTWDSEPN